jgi:NTE family protein
MSTTLVLSGGGSLGAVQVGMLAGLAEAGVEFDAVIGTSVGAINAAWVAADPGPESMERLAGVWRGLRRTDVFPTGPWQAMRAAAGRSRGLVSQHGLRSLLEEHLRFERIEDAPTPLHVVAVDAGTGRSTLLSSGSAVDAVLASAAIPGVLAPVSIDGRWFLDGGVADNCSIGHAVGLGADSVWVLPAGYPCAAPALPTSAIGMALHGLTLLIHQRLAPDVERFRHDVDLRVVPSLCPLSVSPADFSRAHELIESARASTRTWLDRGCPFDAATSMLPHPHAEEPRARDLALPG